MRDALEPALAAAVNQPFASLGAADRAAWVHVFVEAAAVVESDAILDVVESVVATLRTEWSATTRVDAAAAILEACLASADVCDPRTIVPAAIDELERVVGAAYHPGDRLAHDLDAPARRDGDLADHVQCASALLTAYRATARIPYAMLAEELMQSARRMWWDEDAGALAGTTESGDHLFAANCAAARVWCLLGRLHADEPYRRAAVVAPEAEYRLDASRILDSPAVEPTARGIAAAEYGLALIEWQRS